MSYLSIALHRQVERDRHLTQTEIAKASGLSKSYVSRLFNGEAQDISDQSFVAILKIFSANQNAQAELIAARCMDAKASVDRVPGADLVEILLRPKGFSSRPGAQSGSDSEKNQERRPVDLIRLSQETERAFAWLRSQCPVNPDLEKHIVAYARLLGMKRTYRHRHGYPPLGKGQG